MPRAYQCRGCLFKSIVEWVSRCPGCGGYYNIREIASDARGAERSSGTDGEVMSLQDAVDVAGEEEYIETGLSGLDQVLGGGLVAGGIYLLCGDPGVGKSTLILALLHSLAVLKHNVLYLLGEESVGQVAGRAKRLALGKMPARLQVVKQNSLSAVIEHIQDERPEVAVIDSLQTLEGDEDFRPGSAASIKESMSDLNKVAKSEMVALIIIGQINKDGVLNGPKALEHAVDCSLHFSGDQNKTKRVLRCDQKNRWGRTPASVSFLMTQKGLVEIPERGEDDDEDESEDEDLPLPKKLTKALKNVAKGAKKTPAVKAPPAPPPTKKSKKDPLVLTPAAPLLENVKAALEWRSRDGLTVSEVLKESCDVEGCLVGPGKACTSATGKREAGFHESRVDKARAEKKGLPKKTAKRRITSDEPIAAPDPFAKSFENKPRMKKARATISKSV